MFDTREVADNTVPGVSSPDHRHVTLHLVAQATVEFGADQLWPLHGDYARFGIDLPSFANEVTRRLHSDGYVGYRLTGERITIIPISAIKRIDFTQLP